MGPEPTVHEALRHRPAARVRSRALAGKCRRLYEGPQRPHRLKDSSNHEQDNDINIVPTLGPKIYRYDPFWARWSSRDRSKDSSNNDIDNDIKADGNDDGS